MSTSPDAAFSGSIPDSYNRYMVPLYFEPYARDLAERVAARGATRVLEVACGTGVVTQSLHEALPGATIVATDLNDAMLAVAQKRISSPLVTFRQADAQALPFDDASFDAVVCQYGVMFFPDRAGAYREARRVLAAGGTYFFNVWNDIALNPVARCTQEALRERYSGEAPAFLERGPFSYFNVETITAEVRAAGFTRVAHEVVTRRSRASARDAATGLCTGSPLTNELLAREGGRIDGVIDSVAQRMQAEFGDPVDAPMSAIVFTCGA